MWQKCAIMWDSTAERRVCNVNINLAAISLCAVSSVAFIGLTGGSLSSSYIPTPNSGPADQEAGILALRRTMKHSYQSYVTFHTVSVVPKHQDLPSP
jgi:hypothetical protein